MNLSSFSSLIESTYVFNAVLPDTPIFNNIPCRVSFGNRESAKDTEIDFNPINFTPKLFFSLNVKLKAGDYVVVTRSIDTNETSVIYEGNIGLPAVFQTHQEVLFNVEGKPNCIL